jgi:hypothetical protein
MNNFKTSHKFNRKVYIIPAEKFSSLVDMERKNITGESTNDPGTNSSASHSTNDKSTEGQNDNSQKTFTTFKNQLSDKQYHNVMAIAHMIGFNPENNSEHREALLFSQNVTPTPSVPKDVVTFYHLLDIRNVPKTLITNPMVRQRLERMSRLAESDESQDESDNDTDDTDETEDDDDGDDDDILRRAWIYYTKEQEKKKEIARNKRQLKRKRRKMKQQSKSAKIKGSKKIKIGKGKTSPKDITVSPKRHHLNKGNDNNNWVHLF